MMNFEETYKKLISQEMALSELSTDDYNAFNETFKSLPDNDKKEKILDMVDNIENITDDVYVEFFRQKEIGDFIDSILESEDIEE